MFASFDSTVGGIMAFAGLAILMRAVMRNPRGAMKSALFVKGLFSKK